MRGEDQAQQDEPADRHHGDEHRQQHRVALDLWSRPDRLDGTGDAAQGSTTAKGDAHTPARSRTDLTGLSESWR